MSLYITAVLVVVIVIAVAVRSALGELRRIRRRLKRWDTRAAKDISELVRRVDDLAKQCDTFARMVGAFYLPSAFSVEDVSIQRECVQCAWDKYDALRRKSEEDEGTDVGSAEERNRLRNEAEAVWTILEYETRNLHLMMQANQRVRCGDELISDARKRVQEATGADRPSGYGNYRFANEAFDVPAHKRLEGFLEDGPFAKVDKHREVNV
jgi:hypothetical protein